MLDAKTFHYHKLNIYTLNVLGVSIDIQKITFLLIMASNTSVISEGEEVNIYTLIKTIL